MGKEFNYVSVVSFLDAFTYLATLRKMYPTPSRFSPVL